MTIQAASVLVVDDNVDNLTLLEGMLQAAGHAVRAIPDGTLALESVRLEAPDLIVLDILMPGISGWEVCEALKADPATADIPIVFLSALTDIQEKLRAFQMGGVDYITKPFHEEEVLARVNTHVALMQSQRALAARNEELQEALREVNLLSGLLPICSHCKRIRDEQGDWTQIETYISHRSDAQFSHSYCPDCVKRHFPG